MKDCWPDGDLRAYLDGELAADSLEKVAAHLADCRGCSERCHRLTARTAWVSAVMALSESTPAAPRLRPRRWRVAAALALAAALAVAFVTSPKRVPVPPAPVIAAVALPPPIETPAPKVRPVSHRLVPRRLAPTEEFTRLDDEPIETATVVRVSADNGTLQADLIIGPDGRAHAIRVVSNQ